MTSNVVIQYHFQHIINGFVSGFAVAGYENFRGVSTRIVPVVVCLSVTLYVAAGEGVSIVSGGSTEERELLNEE